MKHVHRVGEYRAEYVLFVMHRDYLTCQDCPAEYSLVDRKWYPPASPTTSAVQNSDPCALPSPIDQ